MSRIKDMTVFDGKVNLFNTLSFAIGYKVDRTVEIDMSPFDGVKIKITNSELRDKEKVFFEEFVTLCDVEKMIAALELAKEFYKEYRS